MTLPVARITLYKHGIGQFERRGKVSGESLRLEFPTSAMDDVLKSLVAVDFGTGGVHSIGFTTPQVDAATGARDRIQLGEEGNLRDLFRDLRGCNVRIVGADQSTISGLLVGSDIQADKPTRRGLVTIFIPESGQIQALPISSITSLDLLDTDVRGELSHALATAQGVEDRRTATIVMSPGEHDLLVSYLAPSPAWRVSYRVLGGAATGADPGQASESAVLAGWGIFDNQLDEDLQGVEVSLVAGMPISFRYQLHEPRTPQRPVVVDEDRTVAGPPSFKAAPAPRAMAMAMTARAGELSVEEMRADLADMVAATTAASTGEDRGALFAYHISEPVSVSRGDSAMVPVLNQQVPVARELLYNAGKLAGNPVASLRLTNTTGLTLERGPATILFDGDYAGEAVLPFTTAGAEVVLPYAVELGVTVTSSTSTSQILHAIQFRDDATIFEEYLRYTTTYTLASTLAEEVVVVVERNRTAGHELVATPEPAAANAEFWRWQVSCPSRGESQLVVTEQRLQSRASDVRTLTGADIAALLAAGSLSQANAGRLETLLGIYRMVEAAEAEQRDLIQRIESLTKQQEPIRGNLAALGTERGEAGLRARYVASLTRIQDEIDAADARVQELAASIRKWQEDAAARIGELARG